MPEQISVPWDDLFSDELGTVWIVKRDRTAEQALAIAVAVEGDDVTNEPTVREVRGRIEGREGEQWWFTPNDNGPVEVWEVSW